MSAIYARGAFELVESDFELRELLWPVAAATPLAPAVELEEAVHFDEAQHPRWPKGTPKGGQFIRAGQSFALKGHQYEVAHVVKGKIYAHLKGGKSAQTIEVKTSEIAGFDKAHPAKVHVAPGIEAPTASVLKGGKGQDSTITAVSPYVDHASHDPSIPIPAQSPVTAEEWTRFGKIDQEHYVELQERFGKWTPGDAKPLVDKAYKEYEAKTADVVKSAYSAQYGSSTGYSLSLVSSLLSKLGLGHGGQLPASAAEEREKAMMLQAEHRAAVQWDLYNRTHSPDIFAVHKTGDSKSFWGEILSGKKRVFSGLSQTFQYRVGGFGSTGVATPLAIRHILLSSDSALPVQTSFLKEYEISVPEQLVLDSRSVVFTDQGLDADTRSWLSGSTNVPRGAYIHDIFKDHLEKGTPLPEIPAPAMIQMDGQSGKTWIDPEPEAWKGVSARAVKKTVANDMNVGDHFRQGGTSFQVQSIDADGSIHGLEHPGSGKKTAKLKPYDEVEVAKPISVSGLTAGEYVMGLQGSRYVIVSDPGDSTYGLRYVEITDSGLTGQAYQLKAGGSRQFYRLEGSYKPTPKAIEDKPPFEPAGWTAGAGDQGFVSKLPEGSKFKVNGNYYEVSSQLGHGQTKIQDLTTGKSGQINSNYQTHVLVPKSGYTPPAGTLLPGGQVVAAYTPQKGDWLAIDGEKWEVSTFQKSTKQWRLKRAGQPVKLLSADDEAFKGAYRPSDYVIGEKQKLRDFAVGDKFHMGAGAKQKPYEVVSHGGPGKPTKVKDLTTGKESDVSRNASYSKLVPHTDDQGEPTLAQTPPFTPPAPAEPAKVAEPEPVDPNKPFSFDDFNVAEKGKNLKGLQRGDTFAFYKQPHAMSQAYKVIAYKGELDAKGKYPKVEILGINGPYKGKKLTISTAKIVYPMQRKKGLAAGPDESSLAPVISNFDPTQYALGAQVPLSYMDKGAIVQTGPNGPYFKITGEKKGSQIGVTAMISGASGFMAPETPAKKLNPKAGSAGPVPYENLKQGDLAQLETLKAGDQFTYPGDPSTYALVTPPDDTWSAMVAFVGDDGSLSAPSKSVLGTGSTVVFHKKGDDATTDWWKDKGTVTELDPNGLPKAPNFAGYGSAYASGAKAKGGFSGKHDKVSAMVPGTVFRDKSGGLWKVKAGGAAPIITDGKANYSVDGSLRGRVALYMTDLPAGDSSPAVGQSGLDYSQAAAESLLGPNVGNKELAEMPVGTVWKMEHSGALYMIEDHKSDAVTVVNLKDGHSVDVVPHHIPKSVAIPPASAQAPAPPQQAEPSAADDDPLAAAMHAAHAALKPSSSASAPSPASVPGGKPYEGPATVYRTEKAHAAYKGKSSWGSGQYFGVDPQDVADLQLDPDSSYKQAPVGLENVTKATVDPSKLLTLDDDEQQINLHGEALKKAVLDAGYAGVHLKGLSANLGGEQVVVYDSSALKSAGQPLDPIFDAPGFDVAPKPEEKPLSSFSIGDHIHFGVGDWEIAKQGQNQYGVQTAWLKALNGPAEGQTLAMPGNLSATGLESAPGGGPALEGNPGGLLLAQMNPGDIVQLAPANGGGTWKIVKMGAADVQATKLAGSLGSDDIDAPGVGETWSLVAHWSPIAISPGAAAEKEPAAADDDPLAAALKAALASVHGGDKTPDELEAEMEGQSFGGSVGETLPKLKPQPGDLDYVPPVSGEALHGGLMATLEQIKEAHGGSLQGVPYGDQLQPFKSAWGTGGAYKHPPLSELGFGEKFTDKTGAVYRFITLTGNNQAIIVSDSDGQATKVPAGLRVKTKGVG